ncbi:MAG: hypothetical protein Q7R52_04245 [archaeon]|nr:hypothetical protein [archaeon]
MKIETKKFDILKWNTCLPTIQQHIQKLLSQTVDNPENFFYRGGFGQREDFDRLLKTGSDYESATVTIHNTARAAVYASSFERVGNEPWCRGLDPLYWALIGHPKNTRWNLINCIVAYSLSQMDIYAPDVLLFKSEKPSPESIEAVLILEFDKNKKPFS